MDLIPGTLIKNYFPILNSLFNLLNPQDTALISFSDIINQQTCPILPGTVASSRGSLKHRLPDSSNGQGTINKRNENPRIVIDITGKKDGHAKEKQPHVNSNANFTGRDSDSKPKNNHNDGIKTAEALEFATMATLFEQTL